MFFIIFLLVVIPLTAIIFIMLRSVRISEVQSGVSDMKSQAVVLAAKIASSDILDNRTSGDMVIKAQIQQQAELFNGRIQIINSAYRVVEDTFITDIGKFNYSENVINCMIANSVDTSFETAEIIEIAQPIIRTGADGQPSIVGVITVSSDKKSMEGMVKSLSDLSILIVLILVFVMIPLLLLVTYRLVKPFIELSGQIAKMPETGGGRVDVRTYKETASISDSFNDTYGRLEALSESRQEFISNVSHELKTPITSIRVLADSLMGIEDAPLELYQEFMADISEEIDREAKIIDDLLSLTRLDSQSSALDITKVNVNAMMELILKRLRPLAKQRNIELLYESFRPVAAELDEVKFSLAITNLVENAIKYNVDGGWVKLSLNADYQYFFIKVADSGVGIPEDAQGRIFDRFYRVDKARSRETGGTGLGLSITKSVITLHRGAIRVYSKPGEGTTFVVRVPLVYQAEPS